MGQLVQPRRAEEAEELDGVLVEPRAHLAVAVQVDPFESKLLKTGFSLHRLKGCETGALKPGFSLHRLKGCETGCFQAMDLNWNQLVHIPTSCSAASCSAAAL
jgi:hypothetical protein